MEHDQAQLRSDLNGSRQRISESHSAPNGEDLQETLALVEQAKQEWEATVDSLPQLICLLDQQGRILRANRTLEAWGLGRVVHVKGRELHSLLHPNCADPACYLVTLLTEAWAGLAQGRPTERQIEDRVLQRHLRIQVQPVSSATRIDYASASFAVLVAHDIAPQMQAEWKLWEAERRFRTLLDSVHLVAVGLGPEGRVVYANPYLLELTGYTREEVLGQDWFQIFIPPRNRPALDVVFAELLVQGLHPHYENPILTKSGQERLIAWNNTLLLDPEGKPVGTMSIGEDITERRRAEEEVRRLKEFNESIVQNVGEGIAVQDADGYFTFVNPAAATLLGYMVDELIGRHWTIIIPPDQHPIVQAADARRTRGEADRYELQLLRKDGERIHAIVSGNPRFDPETGRFAGTMAVFADITRRVRAEEALRQYAKRLENLREIDQATLAAQSPQAIAQATLKRVRQLVPCQRASVTLFDWENSQLQVLAVDADGDTQARKDSRFPLDLYENVETLRRNEIHVVEDILALSSPSALERTLQAEGVRAFINVPLAAHHELIGSLNLGTEKPGAFALEHIEIAREVANQLAVGIHQSWLREELELHTKNLETLVAARTSELQMALERATSADRVKSEFVSNVSHELRTPLANIKLYLTLLTQGRPDKHQLYMDVLHRETGRLQTLIEGLLDLSRLELGKMQTNLRPTDLNLLVRTLAADRAALIADRGLALDVKTHTDLPLVLADAKLIEQVITNLLTNAINYTPAGGAITLCTSTAQVGGQVWGTVSVSDTGPGISAEDYTRLFERFFRGQAGRASDAPGTGLGLAICKEIVDRHAGQITVESQVGKGSTFAVWLRSL
jgi:PAS domain S-box-containing protein